MKSQLMRLVWIAGLFLLLCSVLFIFNQSAQVVALAAAVNPLFGKFVLVGLLAAFGLAVLVPLVMIARMPKALRPPPGTQTSEYQDYLRRLGARLKKNPHLAGTGLDVSGRPGIEAALLSLEEDVKKIIKKTATNIFVSTAISQNGRLDALMVLAAQSQMIWQIARVYNQRPALRDMIRLYSNVGVTIFVASQIEDVDITEQVEPVIKAALTGALAGLVPGIAAVTSMVTHSILEGTANAYLTLRVGIVCQTYCSSLEAVDRKSARRNATVGAASMLGSIVGESATRVVRAIFSVAKKAGVSKMDAATAGLQRAGKQIFKPRESKAPEVEN